MNILIKNGLVIDPANNIEEVMNVVVENDKITYVGKELPSHIEFKSYYDINDKSCLDDYYTVEADGMWVTPGFIDLHVHLRTPGFEQKETIETGSKSAAAGGFTTICPMANTNPVTDSLELVEKLSEKAKECGIVNILPISSVTKGMEGTELTDIEKIAESVCAFSEDGHTVANPKILKDAMKILAELDKNIPIMSHCEDKSLLNGGAINEGYMSNKYNIKPISNDVEDVITARNIILAKSTKASVHMCHVSTAGSVDLIREAKKNGVKVTAEVAPHHFTLCDVNIPEITLNDGAVTLDANYKMAPPLRSEEDVMAMIEGLKDGTIDCIATDHAPHEAETKNYNLENEFSCCANGIVGLETALPLGITELVEKNVLTKMEFIKKLTLNPAKIIGIDKGNIAVGKIADITIINPNKRKTIDSNEFYTKGRNTPFNGMFLKGVVSHTIVNGKVVFANEQIVD